MTREDIDRLFELFRVFRPGDPKVDNKVLRSAWALVLEPYEPDEVRRAVADYFRENKFFPDVTDISVRCPRRPEPVRGQAPELGAAQEKEQELQAWWEARKKALEQAGLPCGARWVQGGGTAEEYWNRLESAGIV